MHRSEIVFLRSYSSSTHIADLLILDNGQLPHTCPNSTNLSIFEGHFHSSILHAPWYWQCCLKGDYLTSTLLPIVECGFHLWDWWMKCLSSDKSKFVSGSSWTHTLSHWSDFPKIKKTQTVNQVINMLENIPVCICFKSQQPEAVLVVLNITGKAETRKFIEDKQYFMQEERFAGLKPCPKHSFNLLTWSLNGYAWDWNVNKCVQVLSSNSQNFPVKTE